MELKEQYATIKYDAVEQLWQLMSNLHAFVNEEFDQTPRVIELLDMIQHIISELEFIEENAEEENWN